MYEIDPANVRSPREFDNPKFDLGPRRSPSSSGSKVQLTFEEMSSVIKLKPPPKTTWEPDVRAMISAKKWLSTYGLKRNRLKLDQILGTIGFRHSDDFDRALKKPVCSRYGEGLFTRFPRRDGKIYNVNVKISKEKIKQIENSLLQAINLYKRRIDWLTSESRRLFGVIEEHCICIVIDIKTNSPSHFDHCRNALIRVLEDQVSQVAKFNLIRAAQDMVMFQKHAVPVTKDSLHEAMEWVRTLDGVAATTETSACEGILKALTDRNIEAVFLFSEGSSANTAMELTFQKVKGCPLPVNTVAFNSTDSTTVHFLKDMAQLTGGRFHAFAFNKLDSDVNGNSSYNHDTKAPLSGVPPGAGTREDVVSMWQELEEARAILGEVQTIMEHVPNTRQDVPDEVPVETKGPQKERSEQYMSSKEWLAKRGLKSRKLDLYDVLATCSFRHCDGVVDIKQAPHTDYTDAETRNKLVNAKYCDKFCHFHWKDGSIKHVHVTADVHRVYERKMNAALGDLQRRLDWLQQGSRELFGTIVEDQVYILIDISNSMENHLGLVKEKMFRLMQEQLRHKTKFNLVKFGSKASGWKDRAVEVNENSLQSAWQWIRGLEVAGSTNSLMALKTALADPATQAIYLLTDGRPDHPPPTILAQVQLQKSIPIHCISFNCNDREANDFMALLSSDTGGRYHYYADDLDVEPEGPQPFESEDRLLIREEIKKGKDDLKKLADLRGQCALLDWSNKSSKEMGCGKEHAIPKRPMSATGSRSASQILSRDSSSMHLPKTNRPQSAKTYAPRRPMSALSMTSTTSHDYCHPKGRSRTTTFPPRPRPSKEPRSKTPNIAYHNKTSWLRLKGSLDGWAVPETQVLLNKQQERYITALQDLAKQQDNSKKKKLKKKKADPLQVSSKRWLKKNGLIAKKLTIYDALGGTMVKQKAKYVPILDKYVISQVFNEVLPLAHVTGNRQEINLINPGAVDLKVYEDKVKTALNLYRRRLDTIVWNALSEDERDRLEPDSFLDNRHDYMEALERLGWPIPEKDIILLEEEIEKGERYLRKSEALRKHIRDQRLGQSSESHKVKGHSKTSMETARSSTRMDGFDEVDEKDSDDEEDDDDDDDDKDSDQDDDDKDSDQDLVDDTDKLERSPRSYGNQSASDKDSLASSSSPEEEDEYLSSEKDSHEEAGLRRRSSGLKTSPQSHVQKSKKAGTKGKGVKTMNPFSQGARIVGRSKQDGLYYPGVVVRVPNVTQIDVFFPVVGDKVRISSTSAIQLKGAQAQPKLITGDCVLMRQDGAEDEVWIPGMIMVGPVDETRQSKFYTIVTYNAEKVSVQRNTLLKISKQEYNSMVRFIMDVQGPYMSKDDRDSIVTIDKLKRLAAEKNKKKQEERRKDFDELDEKSSEEEEEEKEEEEDDDSSEEEDEEKSEDAHSDLASSRSSHHSNHSDRSDAEEEDHHDDESDKENAKDEPSVISSEIKERLVDLQQQLTSQHDEYIGNQKAMQEDLEEQKRQTKEFQRVAERHEALLEEHTGLKDKYDLIQGRYQRLRKRAETLLNKHNVLEGQHTQLESTHKDLTDRLSNIQQAHGSKETENESLASKYQELLERLDQMELERRETKEQLAGVHTQKETLEQEIADMKRRSETLGDSGIQSKELTNKSTEDNSYRVEEEGKEEGQEEGHGEGSDAPSDTGSIRDEIDGVQDHTSSGHDEMDTPRQPVDESEQEEERGEDDVIAYSPDTGWFIQGTIESRAEDGEYYIVDNNNTVMKVHERLILQDKHMPNQVLQVGDTVIGRHPDCPPSYAPATIQRALPDLWYQVRFYNGVLAQVPSEHLYPIACHLQEQLIEDILKKEDGWVGHPVVARKEEDGRYYLGVVKTRIERSPMYEVEWADETMSLQNSRHIFGSFTRRQKMALGDYVLAMISEALMTYLPGKVTGVSGNKLTVEFCDGSSFNTIDPVQCYWLSESYYQEAEDFYLSNQDVTKATGDGMYPSSSSSSSSTDDEGKGKKTKKRKGKRRDSNASSSSSLSVRSKGFGFLD